MSDRPTPFHTPDSPPDWEALARYQAGESPEAEARAVSAWLAAHPADAELLAAIGTATVNATALPAIGDDEIDVEAALRRVKARRDLEGSAAAPRVLPLEPRVGADARPRRWLTGGLAAAAVALLAIGIARSGDVKRLVAGDGVAAPAGARVVATAVGARDSVLLPDGTRIDLAPASRLTIPADYGRVLRTVALEGAALFTVTHDAARPFAVRAGDALVRDVGTTFSVRTDGAAGARTVAVAVTEGVVALGSIAPRDTGVTLAAGDRGELRDGRVVVERDAVTAEDVAWARGRLVYRAAPLDLVRADLQRWYGVDLVVADSALARRRLTASFEGESAAQVLDVVALALGATVERDGRTATLREGRPAAP